MPIQTHELVLMNSGTDHSAFVVSREDYGKAGIGYRFQTMLPNGEGVTALIPENRIHQLIKFLQEHVEGPKFKIPEEYRHPPNIKMPMPEEDD